MLNLSSSMILLHLLLLSSLFINPEGVKICRESQARLFTGNNKCYQLIINIQSYTIAQSQCTTISDGNLVSIISKEEDLFITGNFSGDFPLWIGLSDRSNEGEFRWEEPDMVHLPETHYNRWKTDWMLDDGNFEDCVIYNENVEWEIRSCNFNYPYLCKFESCDSNDGVYCIGEAPTTPPEPFDIIPVVAIVVVLLIILIIVVVVIVLLFYLYKKQNDVWKRMCACFTFKQAKQKVHGLEQENFRLRKELGGLKNTSINLSGSQSLTRPRVIPSIPDGQGGMLPTIRPPLSSPIVHPPNLLSTSSDPSKPGPPPLAQNTALLQSSMNYSTRSNLVPTPLSQPNMNSSITSDQIAGILWSQKSDFQVPKKPLLNAGQQYGPSRSLFQSPFPVSSTPFMFPNSGNPITSPPPGQLKINNLDSADKNTKQDKPSEAEKEESKLESTGDGDGDDKKVTREDKQ